MWRSRVEVATAVETLLKERLNCDGLLTPEGVEVGSGTESLEPFVETKDEGVYSADDEEPDVGFQPASGGGKEESGDSDEGGDDDEYAVCESRC